MHSYLKQNYHYQNNSIPELLNGYGNLVIQMYKNLQTKPNKVFSYVNVILIDNTQTEYTILNEIEHVCDTGALYKEYDSYVHYQTAKVLYGHLTYTKTYKSSD